MGALPYVTLDVRVIGSNIKTRCRGSDDLTKLAKLVTKNSLDQIRIISIYMVYFYDEWSGNITVDGDCLINIE